MRIVFQRNSLMVIGGGDPLNPSRVESSPPQALHRASDCRGLIADHLPAAIAVHPNRDVSSRIVESLTRVHALGAPASEHDGHILVYLDLILIALGYFPVPVSRPKRSEGLLLCDQLSPAIDLFVLGSH